MFDFLRKLSYNILKEELDGKMVVLLGMEINFYEGDNDYLVYGVTEEFLRSNGDLMDYSPEDFSELCKKNDLLFLQAHSFLHFLLPRFVRFLKFCINQLIIIKY